MVCLARCATGVPSTILGRNFQRCMAAKAAASKRRGGRIHDLDVGDRAVRADDYFHRHPALDARLLGASRVDRRNAHHGDGVGVEAGQALAGAEGAEVGAAAVVDGQADGRHVHAQFTGHAIDAGGEVRRFGTSSAAGAAPADAVLGVDLGVRRSMRMKFR